MIDALYDEEHSVQKAAADGILLFHGTREELSLERATYDGWFPSRWAWFIDPDAVFETNRLVKSETPSIRRAAIIVLCHVGHSTVVGTLAPLLDEEGLAERVLIAKSFGLIHFDLNDKSDLARLDCAGEAMARCLSSSELELRRQSAETLNRREFPAARTALAHALTDPDSYTREQAALALARLKDERCVPTLINIVESDKVMSDYKAVEALGKMRSPKAIPALTRKATTAKFDFVRKRYLDAISAIDTVQGDKVAASLPPFPGEVVATKTSHEDSLAKILVSLAAVGMVISARAEKADKTIGSRREFFLPWQWFRKRGQSGEQIDQSPSERSLGSD